MPTHRVFPGTKQDRIRFKNLIREAEERLKALGHHSQDAKKMLRPAEALIDDAAFWRHQADGLATFISADSFHQFRLPLEFDELVVVADRFHIKPLLPFFSHDGRFYILALSQNLVRLFECTRYGVKETELENVLRSMSEALKYDDPEKQLQFQTGTPKAGGERAAMFHGHGGGKDKAKDNILRFFHLLDKGLRALLTAETAPLVLAGVDYLLPVYREANSYPHLLERGIAGNPEALRGEDLRGQAWEIVEPHFLKAQEQAVSLYRQLAGTGRTSTSVEEIVPKAFEGRIEILFVAVGVQQWGVFDPDKRVAHLHPEPVQADEDLLDLAAVHTYLKGGTVYALKLEEVPEQTPLVAVFRY